MRFGTLHGQTYVKCSLRTKAALFLGCGAIGTWMLWFAAGFSEPRSSQQAISSAAELPQMPASTDAGPFRRQHSQPASDGTNSVQQASTKLPDWRSRMLGGELTALPREKIDRWVELNRTNAESLLAARQAGGGQEFLLEALKRYPDDPRVLYASIILDDSAEAKRERLDRFKAVSPDNALPYYLSAREHLKQSEPDKAVNDLIAAAGMKGFEDYTVDAMQNAEELYLSTGASAADAKVMGGMSVLLPHLAQLKDLTVQLMDLRQQYLASGDRESAENLTRSALHLGDQLTSGDGSRFAINQLVGTAIQQIALNRLEPDQPYDFLAGSVSERKEQLAALKDATRSDAKMIEQWLATADEERVINYFERIKLYGERSAFDWVKKTR